MRLITAMVRLRLLQIYRNPVTLIWLVGMPMIFSFLMGEIMGGTTSGGDGAPLPRFVVALGGSESEIAGLLAPMNSNDRFQIIRSDSSLDLATARREVMAHRATAVLLAAPGSVPAKTRALQLVYDRDRLSGQSVNTALDRSVLRFNTLAAARRIATNPANGASGFDENVFGDLWAQPHLAMRSEKLGRLPDDDWGLTNIHQHVGPAYVLFFVMMFLMQTAKIVVETRESHALARLITSRARSRDLIGGFFGGGLVVGLVQASLLLALNKLAFGLDYGDSPAALWLMIVLFASFAAAAAVFVGCIAKTPAQADGLGMALTMTMASLGGLWWPLEVVPEVMQKIGHLLPTGQAITVFHDLIGRGAGLAEVSDLLMGLALWCVLALVLGSWRLRRLVAP